jgi:hypothetical protein
MPSMPSSGPVITPMPLKTAPVMNVMEPATKSKMDKVIKSLIIVIIVLALIGAAAYFIYTKFLDKQVEQYQTTPAAETNTPATTEIPTLSEPQITPTPETPVVTPATTTAEVTSTPVIKDTDADGLSDEEELSLGTNPNIVDTDADGLSDYDEVKVYHTNPKIVDTDGDGYKDGDEVKSGYNPNGAGKLAK